MRRTGSQGLPSLAHIVCGTSHRGGNKLSIVNTSHTTYTSNTTRETKITYTLCQSNADSAGIHPMSHQWCAFMQLLKSMYSSISHVDYTDTGQHILLTRKQQSARLNCSPAKHTCLPPESTQLLCKLIGHMPIITLWYGVGVRYTKLVSF